MFPPLEWMIQVAKQTEQEFQHDLNHYYEQNTDSHFGIPTASQYPDLQ